jgi:hypothetical protein
MGKKVTRYEEFINEDGGPPQGPSIVTVPGNWAGTYVNSRNYHPMGQAQLPLVVDPMFNSENIYNYDEFMAANQEWMKPLVSLKKSKRKKKKK